MIPADTPYAEHHGYDPVADTEFLLRIYVDGERTVSKRPGFGSTDITWSPEESLGRLPVRSLLDGAVA